MYDDHPIPATGKLIPYEGGIRKKRKARGILLFLAVLLALAICLALKSGIFAFFQDFFDKSPTPDPMKVLYEFDRSRLAAGEFAIVPVDLGIGKNGSRFEGQAPFDTEALTPLPFPKGANPTVLLINTHPYEGYAPDGAYAFSDPTALADVPQERRVTAVTLHLTETLEKAGIHAVYVENPVNSGRDSYKNASAALEKALAEHPEAVLILDIHRAVMEEENGDILRPVTLTEGEPTASLRFVVGMGNAPSEREKDRAATALCFEKAVSERYPALMMPTLLSPLRLNQHLPVPCLTVEIGTCGNGIGEATLAAERLGEVLASLIKS